MREAEWELILSTLRKILENSEELRELPETYPQETLEILARSGFLGLNIPEVYGGMGFSIKECCRIVEELALYDLSLAGIISAHALAIEPILLGASEAQRQRYLPRLAAGEFLAAFALTEPEAGSDVSGLKTLASGVDGGFVINGTKTFISNGGIAGLYVVFASTNPLQGSRGLSAFLIEKGVPGFRFGVQWDKMGMKGSPTGELIFEQCVIPEQSLLGGIGEGFRLAMETLNRTRPIVAAQALGVSRAALQEGIAYSRTRVQFGHPIADFQAIQFMLAEMATEIQAASELVSRAATDLDGGNQGVQLSAMAKLFASEVCGRVVDKVLQIHGGSGYMKGTKIERLYRDARILRIYEGTSEIQKLVIARQLLKS